jgi:hypothetical protein
MHELNPFDNSDLTMRACLLVRMGCFLHVYFTLFDKVNPRKRMIRVRFIGYLDEITCLRKQTNKQLCLSSYASKRRTFGGRPVITKLFCIKCHDCFTRTLYFDFVNISVSANQI